MLERLKLTSDPFYANASLARARDGDELLWPEEVFFTGQHPVMEWVSDKLLQQVGRNEAPVLRAQVDSVTFVVQGLYSNRNGQATVVEWMAIDHLDGTPRTRSLDEMLVAAKVGPRMPNPGGLGDPAQLKTAQGLVPAAVRAGREYVKAVRQERSATMQAAVKVHHRRLDDWRKQSNMLAEQLQLAGVKDKKIKHIDHIAKAQERLIERLASEGDPLVRVVAVLLP